MTFFGKYRTNKLYDETHLTVSNPHFISQVLFCRNLAVDPIF